MAFLILLFAFDAFVVLITFAFSGAFGALLIPHKPYLAIIYALYSVVSMASAFLFLILGLYFYFFSCECPLI